MSHSVSQFNYYFNHRLELKNTLGIGNVLKFSKVGSAERIRPGPGDGLDYLIEGGSLGSREGWVHMAAALLG